MFYYYLLYVKYIKYCILSMPLKVRTISYESAKCESTFVDAPNKFYELKTGGGRSAIAIFYNLYKCEETKLYKKKYRYCFIYYWMFLGYENKKLMKDCSWIEFKDIYTSLFYPHLSSEDEVISLLVGDKLCAEDESIESSFRIRFKIK